MGVRARGTLALLAAVAASLYRSSAHSNASVIDDIATRGAPKHSPRHVHAKDSWKKSQPKRYRSKHNKKNYGGPKHRY
jgi:hypothetical protein